MTNPDPKLFDERVEKPATDQRPARVVYDYKKGKAPKVAPRAATKPATVGGVTTKTPSVKAPEEG